MKLDYKLCWHSRSLLETALLLVMIVAVPYFIGIVVTYVVMLGGHDMSVQCFRYCESIGGIVNPQGANEEVTLFARDGRLDTPCKLEDGGCKYKFLAAILEDVYDEKVEEQRYLGSGVILNHKWIMTSSDIFRNKMGQFKQVDGIFIRVGSDYWHQGGSVHEIKEIAYLGNKDTAPVSVVSAKRSFPVSDQLQPIKLSRKRSISRYSYATSYYGWHSNDALPHRMRIKYISSFQTDVEIMDNRECMQFNQTSNALCASENWVPVYCSHSRGSPLLDGDYLFGIHIAKSCDPTYNSTIHIFENVVSYYSWLSAIVGDIDIEV